MSRSRLVRSVTATVGVGALLLGSLAGAVSAGAATPRTTGDDNTPSRTISGTSVSGTVTSYKQVDVDPQGNIWAVRYQVINNTSSAHALVKFNKNFTSGTPQPSVAIPTPSGTANFDRLQVTADGRILVMTLKSDFSGLELLEYPANPTATSQPTRRINAGSAGIRNGTFVEAPNGELYVSNPLSGGDYEIKVYPSNWTSSSTPTRTIAGLATRLSGNNLQWAPPLAISSSGELLAGWSPPGASGSPEILIFAAGADGDVAPADSIEVGLSGVSPYAIKVNSDGDLVVSSSGGGEIRVYASDASGQVDPTRTIGGSLTMFKAAISGTGLVYGVGGNPADGAGGEIYEFGGTITPPGPDPSVKVPSAPRSLKATPVVRGIVVSMKPSKTQGSSPITRYVASARPTDVRGVEAQTCSITPSATELTCAIKDLDPAYTYRVTAYAVSAAGTGIAASAVNADPIDEWPNDALAISRVNTFNGGARVFFTAPARVKRKASAYVVKMYSTGWTGDRRGCIRTFVTFDPSKMWCDVEGLVGGTIVWFTVTPTFKVNGAGRTSEESKPVMVYSSPGAVTKVEFFFNELRGGFIVRPAAPQETGARPITSYRVVVRETGSVCRIRVGRDDMCTITGLESKVPVNVVVYASNSMGEGPESKPFKIRPR